MRDLTNAKAIILNGFLFVVLGMFASVLLYLRAPAWQTVMLNGLAIWAFARAYYFAFYVLERYVDGSFRYAGLLSVLKYLWRAYGR